MTPEECIDAQAERVDAQAERIGNLERRVAVLIAMRRATGRIPCLCIGSVIGYALGGYPLWAFLIFMGALLAALGVAAVGSRAAPSKKA